MRTRSGYTYPNTNTNTDNEHTFDMYIEDTIHMIYPQFNIEQNTMNGPIPTENTNETQYAKYMVTQVGERYSIMREGYMGSYHTILTRFNGKYYKIYASRRGSNNTVYYRTDIFNC